MPHAQLNMQAEYGHKQIYCPMHLTNLFHPYIFALPLGSLDGVMLDLGSNLQVYIDLYIAGPIKQFGDSTYVHIYTLISNPNIYRRSAETFN